MMAAAAAWPPRAEPPHGPLGGHGLHLTVLEHLELIAAAAACEDGGILVLMKHMSGMWKADVGGDPAALHSLVRILKRALRYSGGPSGTADTGQVPSQPQFPHRWRRCDGTKERVELEHRRSLVSPSLRRVLLRRLCHWMLTWV